MACILRCSHLALAIVGGSPRCPPPREGAISQKERETSPGASHSLKANQSCASPAGHRSWPPSQLLRAEAEVGTGRWALDARLALHGLPVRLSGQVSPQGGLWSWPTEADLRQDPPPSHIPQEGPDSPVLPLPSPWTRSTGPIVTKRGNGADGGSQSLRSLNLPGTRCFLGAQGAGLADGLGDQNPARKHRTPFSGPR